MSINREHLHSGRHCDLQGFGRICPSTQFFYMLNVYPIYQIRTRKGSVDNFLWTGSCGWIHGDGIGDEKCVDGQTLQNGAYSSSMEQSWIVCFVVTYKVQFSKIFKILILRFLVLMSFLSEIPHTSIIVRVFAARNHILVRKFSFITR